ncbi:MULTISPECIES: multicopper oxidase family protein [unclassified Bradyrhizobium]|uniref:multicopper oxidase family protein n=1 Tax=unclassified Bradyrhizobium TaxID=2631580 RepID=UPI001FEEEBF2|nr:MULTISPECIES: multicopper oxidase family protein [unclassified Bradyrhizobium]
MINGETVAVHFTAAERAIALPCFDGRSLPMWTFAEGEWPPVIRLNLGDRLEATLENRLPRAEESTSIHWHGIRLPNDQDGVPYLVQAPVQPGESFLYSFIPPDAGTFWFHTHCNTVEQLGRGLEGILIVDGDTTEPYDSDNVLLLRDWQVDLETGQFSDFYTLRGAARAGTYGALRTANGARNPEIPLPASGDCRLRVINTDPTRVMQIGVEDAEAAIVAIDGLAVQPFPLELWSMGPAMRIDLVLRAPSEGKFARLVDKSPPKRVELAQFVGKGAPRRKTAFNPAPLRASRIPEPNLQNAERLNFLFRASDAGEVISAAEDTLGTTLGSLCISSKIFWTINGLPWPDGDHARLPPPLAVLRREQSYIFTLTNDSPFVHPIHIHGHTFKLLRSNKQSRPQHQADTLLLLPKEQAEVAFVADNPGDWMFHCHVIEHQESGMMGYFRVI